jgi:hypothetical protein
VVWCCFWCGFLCLFVGAFSGSIKFCPIKETKIPEIWDVRAKSSQLMQL